ncbi:hypothetical protein TNCV_2872851 [Trichonephila clavipes]|nr:hypothetical protein TNCV_2872851 [Trichonephila clavipes]
MFNQLAYEESSPLHTSKGNHNQSDPLDVEYKKPSDTFDTTIKPPETTQQHQLTRSPYRSFTYPPIRCDEAHFWLNGYVNKQNCRIWSEANQQVYVETPLHPEKLTVWGALWAGGILLQKR